MNVIKVDGDAKESKQTERVSPFCITHFIFNTRNHLFEPRRSLFILITKRGVQSCFSPVPICLFFFLSLTHMTVDESPAVWRQLLKRST